MEADTNIDIKLIKSLEKLILEKPYDKIKVIDICKDANIPRSTFYYHFTDKNELLHYKTKFYTGKFSSDLSKIKHENINEYIESMKNILINYIIKHEKFYISVFMNTDCSESLDVIFEMISEDLKERLKKEERINPKFNMPIDLIVDYYIGGFSNLTRFWMRNTDKYSKEDFINSIDAFTNMSLTNKF